MKNTGNFPVNEMNGGLSRRWRTIALTIHIYFLANGIVSFLLLTTAHEDIYHMPYSLFINWAWSSFQSFLISLPSLAVVQLLFGRIEKRRMSWLPSFLLCLLSVCVAACLPAILLMATQAWSLVKWALAAGPLAAFLSALLNGFAMNRFIKSFQHEK